MFLYIDNIMYKVSLETVSEKYKREITKAIEPIFNGKILEDVVSEIMENTAFNPVIDSNSVLVDTKDGFRTVVLTESGAKLNGKMYKVEDLYPRYSGPDCKEIRPCLNYTLEKLYDGEGVANPFFINVANSFELIEIPNTRLKQVEDILSEYYPKEVWRQIFRKIRKETIPKDVIFAVSINIDEQQIIQTVDGDFEIKNKVLSVEKLFETIVGFRPKFKAAIAVAQETANRLYNLITYSVDEKSRALPNPVGYVNGKFVFRIQENDLNFYYDYESKKWISEKIQVSTDQLEWEIVARRDTEKVVGYNFEQAFYNGLKLSTCEVNDYETNQAEDEDIPFIAGVRLVHDNAKFYNYIGNFSQISIHSPLILPKEKEKNITGYIRLEL